MKRSLLALTLLAALPFAASAQQSGLNYTYVEGGYSSTEIGDSDVDADGWAVRGSAAVAPNFRVFGDYSSQDIDDTDFSVDQWRAGVGYHQAISPRTDLLTNVAYEKFDAGAGFTYDGWSAEAGVRSQLTANLDGYALAGYEDSDEFDGDFYGRLGATWEFAPNWGINGDVKFADGDAQYFIGPRLSF